MLMLTLVNVFHAAQIAAAAFVLTRLFEDAQILSFWGAWLRRIQWDYPNLYKAFGGCVRCFTGQMALWSGAFVVGLNPFRLVIFILITIFFGEILQANAGRNI